MTRWLVAVGNWFDARLKVRETLLRVTEADTHVLHDPPPEVRLEDFADSALLFQLLVWIPDARLDLRVASDLRFEIEEAFRKEKIEIPFPQRDIHVRSGSLTSSAKS